MIIDITEDAIKGLEPVYGRWPWPRSVYAEVIDYLNANGAKAIGFDILFSEQDERQEVGPETIAELRSFAQNSDIYEVRSALLKRLDSLNPELSDRTFSGAVKRGGNVFLPAVFYAGSKDLERNPGLVPDDADRLAIEAAIKPSSVVSAGAGQRYFNATVPFPALAAASAGIGHINLSPDGDGTYRRYLPLVSFEKNAGAYPALPLLIAAYVKGIGPDRIIADGKSIRVGDVVIPLLSDSSAYIYYQGGIVSKGGLKGASYQSFYRHIPFDHVLASKDLSEAGREPLYPAGAFRDKIVLITASAIGLADLRTTPFSAVTPGIEIHANIIDNILAGRSLKGMGELASALYIILLSSIIAVVAWVSAPARGFAAVVLLMGGVSLTHWRAFSGGYILPIVQPLAAASSTYLGVILLRYIFEQKEKKFLRSAFGHYISPSVLEDVLKFPEKLRLGGERRFMTVLFSDIEGFTTISESMAPEETSRVLNGYLTSMAGCVTVERGTLDKFIGDAVMAFWNAPVPEDEHAALACEAAIRMERAFAGVGTNEGTADGKVTLRTRIGINTGEMVVGNMGSREIFDYTVLGSEVNIAARLEPLNKDFGTHVIVSGATRTEAERSRPGRFVFRRLADVVLKGTNRQITVYELSGVREEMNDATLEAIGTFEKGLDLYMLGRFTEARALFTRTMEVLPDDGPSKAYSRLSAHYEANPPGDGFTGLYAQKTK